MSSYSPDKWVIVKIEHPEHGVHHKILGGWSGGYIDGDSWKLSSGLVKIEEEGDFYLMHNHSGSIYKCHKKAVGMNVISASIYSQMKGQSEEIEGSSVTTITPEQFNKEK